MEINAGVPEDSNQLEIQSFFKKIIYTCDFQIATYHCNHRKHSTVNHSNQKCWYLSANLHIRSTCAFSLSSVLVLSSELEFSSMATSNSDAITPLLPTGEETVAGAVDYKRRPAVRSKHGRWRSGCFIIGNDSHKFQNFPICDSFRVLEFCWVTPTMDVELWSGGGGGAICVLRGSFQLDNVPDGQIGAIHGGGRRQCECLGWSGSSSSHFGGFYCWLSSGQVLCHSCFILPLCLG